MCWSMLTPLAGDLFVCAASRTALIFPSRKHDRGWLNVSWRLRHPQVVASAKGCTCYLFVLKDQVWSINRETCRSGDRRGDLFALCDHWSHIRLTLPIEPNRASHTKLCEQEAQPWKDERKRSQPRHSANVLESVTSSVCTSSLSCMLGVFSRLFMFSNW